MDNYSKDFLEKLLKIASPSGFEKEAAELWRKEAAVYVNVESDFHGNSIARYGRNNNLRIMLAGHIDEIGLMIKYIDEQGFIYFSPIGGWDPQILPGQRVKIYTKNKQNKAIPGVIGRAPIHSLRGTPAEKQAVNFEDLWIDTLYGKNIKELVSPGDYAIIDYEPQFNNQKIISRGLDDKIGAFVVLEALKKYKLLHNKKATGSQPFLPVVYAVATVQEEIGLRGAITSSFAVNPIVGIAVDVTFATDYPRCDKRREGDIKLGAGPAVTIGPNINPKVFELLIEAAKENDIPYQISPSPRGTGTDANAMQITRSGIATGLVSIPNRYMHSPSEMVDINDVENAIELIARFCMKIKDNKFEC